jgi:hypothetical protein
MGLTSELAHAAGVSVHRSGSLELISATDADRLLDQVARAGVRVLGFEGFRVTSGGTRPDMSAIADLSDGEDSAASIEEARAVISQIGATDLFLEFTLQASTRP